MIGIDLQLEQVGYLSRLFINVSPISNFLVVVFELFFRKGQVTSHMQCFFQLYRYVITDFMKLLDSNNYSRYIGNAA